MIFFRFPTVFHKMSMIPSLGDVHMVSPCFPMITPIPPLDPWVRSFWRIVPVAPRVPSMWPASLRRWSTCTSAASCTDAGTVYGGAVVFWGLEKLGKIWGKPGEKQQKHGENLGKSGGTCVNIGEK